MNASITVPRPAPQPAAPTLVPAPVYEEPLIPDNQQGDMATRRRTDTALPLAQVVRSEGIAEEGYALVGYISDGARTRAGSVLEAVSSLRAKAGLASGPMAVLGTTSGVFYGVPVQTARLAADLLRAAGTDPKISFDDVLPDLRALVIDGTVLEFNRPSVETQP